MQRLLKSPLLPIFLIIFVGLLGFGIILPVLPLFAKEFNASPTTIGVLLGTYSLAQFVVTPYYGALSDRYGRRPILIVSQIGTVLSFILLGLAHSLPLLFAARLLDGISGGNIATAQAYISDITAEKDRAKAFGLIGAAFGLGFILGPAIGGLLSADGNFGRAAFAAAAISAVSLLLTIFYLPESRGPELRQQVRQPKLFDVAGLRQAFGIEQLGLLLMIFFVFNFAQAGFQNLLALFGEQRFAWSAARAARDTGFLLAYVGVIAVLMQGGLIGRLVARYGERRLVQAGLVMISLSLFSVAFVSQLWALVVALLPLAVGTSLATPTLNSLISRESPPADVGRILGLSQGMAALARVLGPLCAGVLFDRGGAGAPFVVAGALAALAFGGARRLYEPSAPVTDPRFVRAKARR